MKQTQPKFLKRALPALLLMLSLLAFQSINAQTLINQALAATVTATYSAPWDGDAVTVNNGEVGYGPAGTGTPELAGGSAWWNWSDNRPASESLEYTWTSAQTLSKVILYFWADRTELSGWGDNVAVPESWSLQYWDGSAWADVVLVDGQSYTSNLSAPNEVDFVEISTTKLKLILNAQTNGTTYAGVGVTEWETYTVTLASTDASLSALTATVGDLSPSFASGTYEYKLTVPESTTSVDLNATVNDTGLASKTGDGTISLSGDKSVDIVVTAEAGNTQTYTIHITENLIFNQSFDEDPNLLSSGDYITGAAEPRLKSANGWEPEYAGFSAGGVFEYGSSAQLNGFTVPALDADGVTPAAGSGCLGVQTSWGDQALYFQEVTLPAGNYKISYNAYNAHTANTNTESLVGWIPDAGTSALSSLTSFPVGAWTSEEIYFALDAETSGRIQIGVKDIAGGSGSNPRLFFDDFVLEQLQLSADATLNSLSGVGITSPSFEPGITEYTAFLPSGTTSVDPVVEANNANAQGITGDGVVDLSQSQVSTIVVTAEDGSTKTYTINYVVTSLEHSYDFASDASDAITSGAVDGVLQGGATIVNGAVVTSANGDYVSFDPASMALSSYDAITMETYVTSGNNGGAGGNWTMLNYFGDANGANTFYVSIARGDDKSRASYNNTINADGSELEDSQFHHVVGVLSESFVQLYIDGVLINEVSRTGSFTIGETNALLAKGGYSADPTWNGQIHEFNIYNGVLDASTIATNYASFKRDQSITFAALPDKAVGDEAFDLTASASSGLGVTYISSDENVATISGSTVTIVGAGTTTITASQVGDASFNAATDVTQDLTVTSVSSDATLADLSTDAGYFHGSFDSQTNVYEVLVPAGISTVNVTAVKNHAAATITSGDGAIDMSGGSTSTDVLVTAEDGTTTLTYTINFTVSETNYIFGWDGNTLTGSGTTPFDFGWGNSSGYADASDVDGCCGARFRSSPAGYVYEDGGAAVTGRQQLLRYDGNAASETAAWTFPVQLAENSTYKFSFDYVFGGSGSAPATLTAGVGTTADNVNDVASSANVTASNLTSYRNGELYFETTASGVYYIKFTVNKRSWIGVNNLQLVDYVKADQTITFSSLSDVTEGDAAFDLTGSASSGLDVVYTSSDESVATISGSTVTIVGAGTTDIIASQAGDAQYNAAGDVVQTLTVLPLDQTNYAPSNLTGVVVGRDVTLNWEDNSGVESGYEIEASKDGFGYWVVASLSANVTSHTHSGLIAGSSYEFRVRALGVEVSAWTELLTVTPTEAQQASTPTDLTSTQSGRSVTLNWADNSNVESGYQVQASKDGGSYWIVGSVGSDVTSLTYTGLIDGSSYDFRVKALGDLPDIWDSEWSSLHTVVPVEARRAATPTGLTSTQSGRSVTLSWTDNSNAESGYQVQASKDGGSYWIVGSVGSDVTSLTYTGLIDGSSYDFRVMALGDLPDIWDSEWSALHTVVPSEARRAATPTNVSALVIGMDITISWEDNSNVETGYQIQASKNGGGFWTIATMSSNVMSYDWSGGIAGSNYDFRVRALESGSAIWDSEWSLLGSVSYNPSARMIGGSQDQTEQTFSIYPNPTANCLTIRGEDIRNVKLTDLNGRELRVDITERSGVYQLDMTSVKQGIYLVEITTEETTKIQKVVKK